MDKEPGRPASGLLHGLKLQLPRQRQATVMREPAGVGVGGRFGDTVRSDATCPGRPGDPGTPNAGGPMMARQAKVVEKLRELARNLWWTWQPNVISLFRELDPALWREIDHNPVEFLKRIPPEQLERAAAEMALDSRIDYAFRRLAEYLKNNDSWGSVYAVEPAVAAGRLLLGRVRPAREPADLLRRPRRPGRRPPQERQRPGHPAGRRRPALRPGLLPPDARRQRLAAGDVPRRQPRPAADRAGLRRRRQAAADLDRHARRRAPRAGLAGRGRPDDPAPARLQRARELRVATAR